MRLVLTQDVDKLGKRGEVVTVARGFGRNYLLPRGMARDATPGNVKQVELEQKRHTKQEAKDKASAEQVARELVKVSLTLARKVGEHDHLYGSVTSQDVADALAAHGFELDKRKIELGEPIKALGSFGIPIRLHRDVLAHVNVSVVKED